MSRPAAGQLADGWQMVEFGDVVRQVKADADPETSGLDRYVAGEHMGTDDLHIRSWGTIGDGYLGPAFHRKFVKGQVLYGSRRTYLRKVAVAVFDGICANTTFVLEPNDDRLLPDLLPFVMQTNAFNDHAVKQSRGSVNPYVNFRDIAWYAFPLPPKEEQRRIADILWAADAAVERWREVVVSTEATTRASVEAQLEAFYRSVECRPLSELLTRSPESGYSPVASSVETGHYTLVLSALTSSGYIRGQLKPVTNEARTNETLLRKGDLLVSRANTEDLVGLAGIFDEDRDDVSFPDLMMRLSPNRERISSSYLLEVLLSDRGRRHMRSVAAGTSTSMKKINRVGLGNLVVAVPEMDAQERFLSRVRQLRSSRAAAEVHLAQTSRIRSALLRTLVERGLDV